MKKKNQTCQTLVSAPKIHPSLWVKGQRLKLICTWEPCLLSSNTSVPWENEWRSAVMIAWFTGGDDWNWKMGTAKCKVCWHGGNICKWETPLVAVIQNYNGQLSMNVNNVIAESSLCGCLLGGFMSHLQHKNTAIQSTMCAFQLMVITVERSTMCDTSLAFSWRICCLLKDFFSPRCSRNVTVCWSVLDSGQNTKKIIGGREYLLRRGKKTKVLSWHFSCSSLW